MAQIPYGDGVQNVMPDQRAPDDLQRIDVNPDQFGAAVGRGLDQLGAGVSTATKFFGQVQTDSVTNDTLSRGDALVNSFKSLRGQDALSAQKDLQSQLDGIVATGRNNLGSPEQKLQFDQQVRPYQARYWSGQIATHAEQQGYEFASNTNNDAYKLAVNRAATVSDDPAQVNGAFEDAYNARVKQLHIEGLTSNENLADARAQAGRDVYKTAAAALAVKDPARAQAFVEQNRTLLGTEYPALAEGVRARADQQAGQNLFSSSLNGQPAAASPNGLSQEGPLPPPRGDGGPPPVSANAPATPPPGTPASPLPIPGAITDEQYLGAMRQRTALVAKGNNLTSADRIAWAKIDDIIDAHNAQRGASPAGPVAPASNAAAPAPQMSSSPQPVTQADRDAAFHRTTALQTPGHVMTQAEHDQLVKDDATLQQWDKQGGKLLPTGQPANVPLPPQRGDGGPSADAPLPHPSTVALPVRPIVDPTDRSHDLPPPTPGGAALPYFTKAGSPYGISGSYLTRTWQIESGGKMHPGTSSAGAQGPFQFTPGTAASYGLGNPNDFGASTAAAVRLAADNKASLTHSLGRAPSDAELYLAHQQGAGGAAKLLANPSARAGDLVGDAAIRSNGGDPNAPAAAFTSKWISKFNGTSGAGTGPLPMFVTGFGGTPYVGGAAPDAALPPILSEGVPDITSPAQPAAVQPSLPDAARPAPSSQTPAPVSADEQPQFRDPRADVYARIEASDASPQVKAHAFAAAAQYYHEQDLVSEQNERARKARSDDAFDRYSRAVLSGTAPADVLQRVAADPNLMGESRWTLTRNIMEQAEKANRGDDVKAYGSGYWKGYQEILADAADPNRIRDVNEIYRRAGPDGDLTMKGADKLAEVFGKIQRSTDDKAVETAKAAVLKSYHSRMSIEEEFGNYKVRDPVGEDAFNLKFVPQFEAKFDAAMKAGKDPWDILSDTKGLDALAEQLRPRAAVNAARAAGGTTEPGEATPPVAATDGPPPVPPAEPAPDPVAAPAGSAEASQPAIPPPPGKMAPNEWRPLVMAAPISNSGQAWPTQNWAAVLYDLDRDPSKTNQDRFDRTFGRPGLKAADVLRLMSGAPPSATETGDASLQGLR